MPLGRISHCKERYLTEPQLKISVFIYILVIDPHNARDNVTNFLCIFVHFTITINQLTILRISMKINMIYSVIVVVRLLAMTLKKTLLENGESYKFISLVNSGCWPIYTFQDKLSYANRKKLFTCTCEPFKSWRKL